MAKAAPLSFEQVSEQLAYDPETGVFTWRLGKQGISGAGAVAGGLNKHLGYWTIGVLRQRLYGHRLAWLLTHKSWPTHQIDHIDGDRANNRISNLRACSHAENQQNARRHNKTGFAGVELVPQGVYRARVELGGVRYCGGYHATPEAAHAAYMQLKERLHPFHVS